MAAARCSRSCCKTAGVEPLTERPGRPSRPSTLRAATRELHGKISREPRPRRTCCRICCIRRSFSSTPDHRQQHARTRRSFPPGISSMD